MHRRNFLALAATWSAAACGRIPDFRWIWDNQEDTRREVSQVLDISWNTPEMSEIMQRNYEKNLPEDLSLLEHILCGRFCNQQEFFWAIQDFQSQNGITADGDIGPSTLEKVYLTLFMHRLSDLSAVQQKRFEIYREMRIYPSKTRWVEHLERQVTLHPSSNPRVFSNAYYYGETSGFPLSNRPINSEIAPFVPQYIERQDPVTFSDMVHGKYILRTYINGNLVFASYMSPGNPSHPDGHGIATTQGQWPHTRAWQFSDMYWITGAPSSVRWGPDYYTSDIMPYAVNVVNWIFSHAWNVNWLRRSHGCMRLPMYYAKALYEIFSFTGNRMSWEIHTV